MKRPPRNFVVEVRRPRRATNGNGKSWLEDPRFAAATAVALASAPDYEPEFKPIAPPPTPPLKPQGRILQSLVEPETIAEPAREAEEPPRRRRASSRIAGVPKPEPTRLDSEPPRRRPGRPKKALPVPPEAASEVDSVIKALGETLAARVVAVRKPEPASDTLSHDDARKARHRRILERYVHRGALKPGESWKRRMRKDG